MRIAKGCNEGENLLHGISAINDEYTICGDAFEGQFEANGQLSGGWIEIPRGKITCPKCLAEIMNCKSYRTKRD